MDIYLYEIIEDYNFGENKTEVFNSFCNMIWESDNKQNILNKTIHFTVKKELLNTEVGKVFDCWCNIEYTGYKAASTENDWCSLIRQKINNLYSRYIDKEVIINKDYMHLLNTPKRLYYRWLDGAEMKADELSTIIDSAISEAIRLKLWYQNQKMHLSWSEYKKLINGFLLKIIQRCKLIDEYEKNCGKIRLYDFINEDSLYIRYFCKSLEGEMLKYQKRYYGVRDHKRYKRCEDCGDMFELRAANQHRCVICQKKYNRKNKTEKQKKYRVEKLKA